MSKTSAFAAFEASPADLLGPEVLRAIDMKVIKYVRALAAGDSVTADEIVAVAQTGEPVGEFGEAGAAFLRQALKDARACVEMLETREAVSV